MVQDEQVLVIERQVFDDIGAFQGLKYGVGVYMERFFAEGTARFMPRPAAEADPGFKQIIPYVLMSYNGTFLNYVRGKRGGETRLVGQRSMGIGGHINPVDDMPLFGDFYDTYRTAVEREVEEEVHVQAGHTEHVVALLNDDSNEVGSVHLGVVHLWILEAPKVSRREQMITQMEFLSLEALQAVREEMETWSQLCLDVLPGVMEKVKA